MLLYNLQCKGQPPTTKYYGSNIHSAEVENPCSGCWLFSHLGMGTVSLRELNNLSKAVQVVNGGAWT